MVSCKNTIVYILSNREDVQIDDSKIWPTRPKVSFDLANKQDLRFLQHSRAGQ